jgi:putative thioredoxin
MMGSKRMAPRGGMGGPRGPMPTEGLGGEVVVDVDEVTFQPLVVEASFERPVVIDLWATWCGPCKTLSPILEGLADEGGGQWLLAKVDVDKSPRLAQAFQAQSIPLVVAIFEGQVVDQFMGVKQKPEVERWLTEVFRRCGLKLDKRVEATVPTEPKEAETFWRARLSAKPDDMKAKLGLGRLLFARGEVEAAEKLLGEIPFGVPEHGPAQAALALKELIAEIGQAGGESGVRERMVNTPADPETAYLAAVLEGTSGRYAPALELLVDLVGQRFEPGSPGVAVKARAKKSAALLLEAAGRGDAAVEVQRKRLTRLLF